MNYPVWDVPRLGGGLVIAIIAIFHIVISHFAIGGGFYLPITERIALRKERRDWLDVLKGHSKFFLVLTGVFGAVSGVGIWFSIGLANPEATSTLIHYWVFAWGMEWVVFMAELTSIALYYYLWDRVPDALHVKIGWLYAVTAWLSLVIINGILAFMLTPGAAWLEAAGSGRETFVFWKAFFNPTYWPSLCLRTLVCLSLAGVFALITASRIDGAKQPELKTEMVLWARKWLLPSFVLLPFCVLWYLWNVPAAQRALLTLGVSTIGQGTFSLVTRMALVSLVSSTLIVAVVYVFTAARNAADFRFGTSLAVLFLAVAATASTEHVREMLRKPYVVAGHLYSSGVRGSDVARLNRDGYLARCPWVRPAEREQWAADDGAPERRADAARGELMFRGQCMACHTLDGYRPVRRYLQGRDRESVASVVRLLHERRDDSPYRAFMPPLVGTKAEVEALTDYLASLVSTNAP